MHRWSMLFTGLISALAFAEDAPVSLTASDGTGLKLVSYTARAVVEDPLAFTELSLVFENPQPRVIEGQFRVTLPRGATVSRFAMKLDERWQEGEVVEKQAARRAYEDFLHRRQDPALLEQAAGNEFSARVFPIPANGRKELIVSWSHELVSSTAPYVLPLKGLPKVGTLDVEVFAAGKALAGVKRQAFVPDADVSVGPPRAGRFGVRAGPLLVARVKAVATSTPEPMQRLLLLVDTSASRALGFNAQVGLVRAVLSKLEPAVPVTVAAFDQDVQVVHEGPASGFGEAQVKTLRDRRPLGASNVAAALEWALAQKSAPFPRVVMVTDGVFTAGPTEGDELLALIARLKGAGVQRLDAIAVGGIRDEAVLARLVSGALPKTGTVLDGDSGADTIVPRLQESTVPRVPVTAEDAKVVWPTVMTGVQAGDEAVVVLEVTGAKPVLKLGERRVELSTGIVGVERPLLERVWAQGKIKALLDFQDRGADGPAQKQKVREEITGLSTKYRVLSPYTALLVLEREEDYARFHIDRRALADLLGVEGGRLVVKKRAAETIAAQKPPPEPPKEKDTSEVAAKKAPAAGERLQKMDVAPDADKRREQAPPADAEAEAPKAEPVEERLSASPPPAPRPVPALAVAREPAPAPAARERERTSMRRQTSMVVGAPDEALAADDQPVSKEPWEGPFKEVMVTLREGKTEKALERAKGWREEQPGDVLALIALGEALEATKDLPRAARAYGSVIDLFPERADLRRFAGVRLERIALASALALAIDDFGKAAEQRPDHPASHRMYAWALLKGGQYQKAFAAIEKGVQQRYPDGRFAEAARILREDAGLIAAAWLKAEPGAAAQVKTRLAALGANLEQSPSLRFVLTWETDANDVDFHIRDAKGGHAYYRDMSLPSGGRLYADVTTGYGPECFTVPLSKGKRAGPYRLQAHYYSRGPMGYGLGKLQIIDHDGKGGFTFEERPFVVMVDQAFVDLGVVK